MTKERIEIIRQSLIPFVKKELLEINNDGLGKSDAKEFEKDLNEVLDLAIKTLEQQPSDDKEIIVMDKGTLKYSGHGYVAYNKDWFRKHFATEVAIMTGYDGYIKQPCEDCVSRQAVLDKAELVELEDGQTFYCISPEDVKALLPVTPTKCIANIQFSKEDLKEICKEQMVKEEEQWQAEADLEKMH